MGGPHYKRDNPYLGQMAAGLRRRIRKSLVQYDIGSRGVGTPRGRVGRFVAISGRSGAAAFL